MKASFPTLCALLSAATATVACYIPVPNSLPSAQRADHMGRVVSRSFSLDPPVGRWKVAAFASLSGQFGVNYVESAGSPLGLVASAFNTDSVPWEATAFCHFPKIAWAGDGTVASGPDRCIGIVAQSLPAPFADSGVVLVRLRETLGARRPNPTGFCKPKRGKGDYRVSRLEPVLVGSTRFYLLAQRCETDSTLVSGQDGKVLLRITPISVYSFFFTDGRSGPGSDEWRVLTSFTPIPAPAP